MRKYLLYGVKVVAITVVVYLVVLMLDIVKTVVLVTILNSGV